jgi:hypothetical protein
LSRDPTYHLTVIDDSDDFILAKVVREIQNNQFVIRTSKPHVKVSWRVEAIRNDRWVQKYGYKTEQEKEDSIKGKYVHPELYGMPKEYGIHYRPDVERSALERATPPAHPEPPRAPRLEERKAPVSPPTPSARLRTPERERSLPERKPSQSPRSNRSRYNVGAGFEPAPTAHAPLFKGFPCKV